MKISMDLANHHRLLSDIFPDISAQEAWDRYRLSNEKLDFYEENGYLCNIQILDTEQIEQLRDELDSIKDASHRGHELFYEFNSNESGDPDKVLFHSLGHWRITKGFHDVLWHPRFVVPASQ